MAHGIRQLHWGVPTSDALPPELQGCAAAVALWPAPVDADACFAAAGFHDFADSDEAWDRDWRALVERTLERLGSVGRQTVKKEAERCERVSESFLKRLLRLKTPPLQNLRLSIVEQVLAVTGDDRFGTICIEFGEPASVLLVAGHGHPILWLGWPSADIVPEDFVQSITGALPAARTTLRWQALLPGASRRM